jgi:hypothetical protein
VVVAAVRPDSVAEEVRLARAAAASARADRPARAVTARPGVEDGGGTFFAPLTMSLKPWPGRNLGMVVFFSFTAAPVVGLRAVRAARSAFSKTPKPLMPTFSPLATARVMTSTTDSTAIVAVRLSPSRSVSASIRSVLFTGVLSGDAGAPCPERRR